MLFVVGRARRRASSWTEANKGIGALHPPREPYPFPDIWDPLARVLRPGISSAAFGARTGRARRRLYQGLRLVAEERLVLPCGSIEANGQNRRIIAIGHGSRRKRTAQFTRSRHAPAC
jgi:hypothetical protein